MTRQPAYPEPSQFLGRVIGGEVIAEARTIGVGLFEFVTVADDGTRTAHEVSL